MRFHCKQVNAGLCSMDGIVLVKLTKSKEWKCPSKLNFGESTEGKSLGLPHEG